MFDLYADHWGLRGDPQIRLIVLHLLIALDTDAARSALRDLFDYTRNRTLEPAELELLRAAADPRGASGMLGHDSPPPRGEGQRILAQAHGRPEPG